MLVVDEPAHCRSYLCLGDEFELVDQRPAKTERDRVLFYAARGPVGQGRPARFIDDPAGLDRVRHYGRCLGLTAHDADCGVSGLEHAGNATDKPAAADGDKQRINLRNRRGYFNTACPLARDYLGIVVGRHVEHAMLTGIIAGMNFRVEAVGTEEPYLAAVTPYCVDFRRGRLFRHEYHAFDTQLLHRVRNGSTMIAARCCHAPGPLLLGRQRCEAIRCTAQLE